MKDTVFMFGMMALMSGGIALMLLGLHLRLYSQLKRLKKIVLQMPEMPKREIVREEHYGEKVWVIRLGEFLRKANCLCLHCAKMKPAPDNCPYAQGFYENCQRGNIALMVTRCRDWQPKEK